MSRGKRLGVRLGPTEMKECLKDSIASCVYDFEYEDSASVHFSDLENVEIGHWTTLRFRGI